MRLWLVALLVALPGVAASADSHGGIRCELADEDDAPTILEPGERLTCAFHCTSERVAGILAQGVNLRLALTCGDRTIACAFIATEFALAFVEPPSGDGVCSVEGHLGGVGVVRWATCVA